MSVPQQQPVKAGHVRNPNKAPLTYIAQTPPTIHPDSYILAAAHPTVSQADPAIDGWFLSDFYAFNYLFKGLGSGQKWLTAADPYAVLKKNRTKYHGKGHGEGLLHGSPYQDRKVVLSEDLLETGQLTMPIVVEPNKMVQRFLKEAKEGSELARKKNVPLVLLVFCHGLPNYELMLETSKGLSATTLKGHLEIGTQVMLVTTACYSGGWVIDPDFNNTVMTVAAEEELSIAWPISDSLSRVCGSVFASSFIETLASATSPLIESAAQGVVEGISNLQISSLQPESSSEKQTFSLQPESPNNEQTLTYNSFCQAVWDSCKKLTRLYPYHSFSFCAQQDYWEHSWTGLTGIPVAHYEERWRRLETVSYQGSHERKASMDQNPGNTSFASKIPSALTGGTTDTFDKKIIKSMRKHQVQEMARVFVENACPEEWDEGWNIGYGTVLRRCAKGERPNKLPNPDGWHEEIEIMASIQFRWQLGLLTDCIIKSHELPVPNGEDCLFWHKRAWQLEIEKRMPDRADRQSKILQRLMEGEFIVQPRPEQGPHWPRPWHYMSASILEADLSDESTADLIDKVLLFMRQFKESEEQRFIPDIMEDPYVNTKGRDWLKSVGRRIRGLRNRELPVM
ncbi:hypothetical protein F4861DRAFT_489775 [Xylaria intraflava]|nr:hypothetical protein F4861DRAFT_489775 [Xylaria intraflava]